MEAVVTTLKEVVWKGLGCQEGPLLSRPSQSAGRGRGSRVKFLGSGRSARIGISSSPRVAYVLVHGHAGATARAVQKSLTWVSA